MAAMVLTRRTTGRRRAPRATMPTPTPAIRADATRCLRRKPGPTSPPCPPRAHYRPPPVQKPGGSGPEFRQGEGRGVGVCRPTAFFRILLGVVFHMDENCHVEPLTRTASALEREGAISTQLVVTGMGG